MTRIETERDIDVLRQMARLLDRENERLLARVTTLRREIADLKGEGQEAVQQELEELRALLAQRERSLFGDSSEKRSREKSPPGAAETPTKGHGPTEQKSLPIVDVVHVLDEADRSCPSCGGALSEMADQYEDSEQVCVVERHFVLKHHRRQKYRCACNGHVETALGPVKLQEGGRYSPEFAVEVAVAKYLDHLPLERQVRIMGREGLEVTSQTLWDQIEVVARLLKPTYDAVKRDVLAEPVIGADETHWRLMDQKQGKRWWAWCLSSDRGIYFEILDSRSEKAASQVLDGYSGIVMADGYGAYSALARGSPGFKLVHCWAHVRRKFVEVEENFPRACSEILDLIAELYAVEKSVRDIKDATARHAALLAARQEKSNHVILRIEDWVNAQHALPQSGLGKAILYMGSMWKGLIAFVDDPRIPLDNNATERAIRGPVVGRKNHYGSRSRRGTEVAALFYTLMETAKIRGVDPKQYLTDAVLAALASPGAITLPRAA
jgi:transposase